MAVTAAAPGPYVACARLQRALVPLASSVCLRMRVAAHDRHNPHTIQQLLAEAREGLRPVQA